MKKVLKLTLEDTRKMMDCAINKAIEIGIDMDIAIVDDGGHLMLFTRMAVSYTHLTLPTKA